MAAVKRFGLLGLAGFVAPRHLKAIKETNNNLIAAMDLHDSVGVIDSYFPNARFFTEYERFDRHLEKLRRTGDGIDYLSICTPNYLHDAHVRLALRVKANAICEKPLVINPWNLTQLEELEAETGKRVYSILQLRLLPQLQDLKRQISNGHKVTLRYITRRGDWYLRSWKNDQARSGGLLLNIGIHFFDLLVWLFGDVERAKLVSGTDTSMVGELKLERAHVSWLLSVDEKDLPEGFHPAFRSMKIDGSEIEFSSGFTDLHTRSYEEILKGNGFGIADAKKAIDVCHELRQQL